MRVSHSIIGSKALAKALDKVQDDYEKSYKEHLAAAALKVHREAVKTIRKTEGSSFETRYKPTRLVRVSDPGDPPNTDTGTLIKNIAWTVDESEMVAEVGTNLKYGKYLEFGTKDMEARPWLMPAVEKVKPALMKIFRLGRVKGEKTG